MDAIPNGEWRFLVEFLWKNKIESGYFDTILEKEHAPSMYTPESPDAAPLIFFCKKGGGKWGKVEENV